MWFLWENPQSQLNEGLAIKQLTFVSQTSRMPHSCKCGILRACITCNNLATPGKFVGVSFQWPAHYPIANAFFWCGWFAGLYLTSIENTSVLRLVEFLKNHQLQVFLFSEFENHWFLFFEKTNQNERTTSSGYFESLEKLMIFFMKEPTNLQPVIWFSKFWEPMCDILKPSFWVQH